MKRRTHMLASIVYLFLGACGGGSQESVSTGGDAPSTGGSGSVVTTTPPIVVVVPGEPGGPQPEGVWVSDSLALFVSFTGATWAVDKSSATPAIYRGSVLRQGQQLSSTDMTRIAASTSTSVTLAGQFIDTSSQTLTLTSLGGHSNTPISLEYVAGYFTAPSLAVVVGEYRLSSGEKIVFESSGVVRGADLGCTVLGSVQAPWSDRNVFYFGLQFGASPCLRPNSAVEGIIAPLPNGALLSIAQRRSPDAAALTLLKLN